MNLLQLFLNDKYFFKILYFFSQKLVLKAKKRGVLPLSENRPFAL